MIHNVATDPDNRELFTGKKDGKKICVIAAVTGQSGISNLNIQVSNDKENWATLASYDVENDGVQPFDPSETAALYFRVVCVKGAATAGVWDISVNVQ